MKYAGTLWDPNFKKDINRLKRVQHQHQQLLLYGKRLCHKNVGCPWNAKPLEQNRWKEARLALCSYVYGGPWFDTCTTSVGFPWTSQRRKIKTPSHLKDHVAEPLKDRLVYYRPKCYVVLSSKTDQYKHSFSVETVLDSEFSPHQHCKLYFCWRSESWSIV